PIHYGFEVHLAIDLLENEMRLIDGNRLDADGFVAELAVIDADVELAHLKHARRAEALRGGDLQILEGELAAEEGEVGAVESGAQVEGIGGLFFDVGLD